MALDPRIALEGSIAKTPRFDMLEYAKFKEQQALNQSAIQTANAARPGIEAESAIKKTEADFRKWLEKHDDDFLDADGNVDSIRLTKAIPARFRLQAQGVAGNDLKNRQLEIQNATNDQERAQKLQSFALASTEHAANLLSHIEDPAKRLNQLEILANGTDKMMPGMGIGDFMRSRLSTTPDSRGTPDRAIPQVMPEAVAATNKATLTPLQQREQARADVIIDPEHVKALEQARADVVGAETRGKASLAAEEAAAYTRRLNQGISAAARLQSKFGKPGEWVGSILSRVTRDPDFGAFNDALVEYNRVNGTNHTYDTLGPAQALALLQREAGTSAEREGAQRQLSEGNLPGSPRTPKAPPKADKPKSTEGVRMIHPRTGKVGTVPADRVQEALDAGFKKVK